MFSCDDFIFEIRIRDNAFDELLFIFDQDCARIVPAHFDGGFLNGGFSDAGGNIGFENR